MPYPYNAVTHFPNGQGNVSETNIFSDLRMEDPTLYHIFYEDFDYYNGANWTVTSTITSTQALTSADGGVLLLQFTTFTDNGLLALQKVGEDFLLESGKTFFMKTRLAINSISADFVAGLQITDTTPLSVSQGVYFVKAEGSNGVDFVVRRAATAAGSVSAASFTTVSANSYVTLFCYYDGGSTMWYGAYDQVVGSLNVDNALPNATIGPSFAIQNGGTTTVSAPSMSLDFLMAAKLRSGASER